MSEVQSDEESGAAASQRRAATTPRLSRTVTSLLWAVFFLAAIGGWLTTGDIIVGGSGERVGTSVNERAETTSPDDALFRVRVATTTAEMRPRLLQLRGRTEVEARVQVSAETAGIVREEAADAGVAVANGELLCRLDVGTREANILEARAALAEAEASFEATSRLVRRGFASEIKSRTDRRGLDAARAALARAELDLERTTIAAPIAGIIEERTARVGDYLQVGETCATIVRLDPLLVIAAVPERSVAALTVGQTVEARLVTNEVVEGRLRFISPTADAATRTFRVEAEITNPDGLLRDGVTTDLVIPLSSEPAHRLRQSALSLADDGRIGVKTVTPDDIVRFVPVSIIGDDRDSLYVTGLPDRAQIITVGQEYVVDGQRVLPIAEQQTAAAPAAGQNSVVRQP